MSERWQFRRAVRHAANVSFPDSTPRLPLFGSTADTRFAVLDGRLGRRRDLGFLVLRSAIEQSDASDVTVYVDRVPASCVFRGAEEGTLLMRLRAHSERVGGGVLALHIGTAHPNGSSFNGDLILPEAYLSLPTEQTEASAPTAYAQLAA